MLAGSMTEVSVRARLAQAMEKPEDYMVYIVECNALRRTPDQNKLFRRIIRQLAQQLGHSVAYWHDYLVERFLGFDELETEDGCYRRKVLCSTADLTVDEFRNFLTACLTTAADLQVHLGK